MLQGSCQPLGKVRKGTKDWDCLQVHGLCLHTRSLPWEGSVRSHELAARVMEPEPKTRAERLGSHHRHPNSGKWLQQRPAYRYRQLFRLKKQRFEVVES